MERLADAGAVCSVGSRGDSYDNALAEAVNALYKAAVIRKPPLAVSRAKALSLHKTQGDSTPREGAFRQADCVLYDGAWGGWAVLASAANSGWQGEPCISRRPACGAAST